jgi:cell division protein FtsI (penicillin-binding protein 3)
MTDSARGRVKPAEPWRQRLIRSLLYGRNVDRSAKARARVGLAIVAFAAIYAVIGGRLVMFAVGGDIHGARRTAAQDAIATARPDIVDRNGEILATDIKAPSLFGEPRRIIDKDEAIELLTATLPDLDTGEVRERLSGKKGFVWLKREITPSQQQEIHRLGIPGIGFLRENKRVYPTGAEVAHLIGLVNIDNQGIAGMEKWLDSNGLADLHRAGFATDRLQRPVELSVDLRVQGGLRPGLQRQDRRDRGDGVGAGFRSQQSERGARPRSHQPADHRRLRDGIDLQGLHAGDGAGFRQSRSQLDVGCARSAALRQVHDP